jgi:predicted transcriptional regulator
LNRLLTSQNLPMLEPLSTRPTRTFSLSDTQLVLLSKAAQREDREIHLPISLRGGAAEKLLASLLNKKLIEQVEDIGSSVDSECLNTPARYRISKHGLCAIGVDNNAGEVELPEIEKPERATRSRSKIDLVMDLLMMPDGASIEEVMKITNWLPHTVRAALSGLRKRGALIERRKREDGVTIYSINSTAAADKEEVVQ